MMFQTGIKNRNLLAKSNKCEKMQSGWELLYVYFYNMQLFYFRTISI